MSALAWRILALFIEHGERAYKGEYGRGYLAPWTLGELLGRWYTYPTIDAVLVKTYPSNQYEHALKELIDLGLIEEMEDLHCRYRLIVKESKL